MRNFVVLFRADRSPATDLRWSFLLDRVNHEKVMGRVILNDEDFLLIEFPSAGSLMDCHFLTEACGVVFGHLFHPTPTGEVDDVSQKAPPNISFSETQKIIESDGRWLCQNYWGSYVAVIRNKKNKTLTVLRSPLGMLPCFSYLIDGVHIIFTDPNILKIFGQKELKVDWEYALQFLKYAYAYRERTAIAGISWLMSGQSINIKADSVTTQYLWNPIDIAKERIGDDVDNTIVKLRNTAYSCFRSWATVIPSGLLTLSGGFDSSFVAGCMASTPENPEMLCQTFYHKNGTLDDERMYARITAARNGHKLIETALDSISLDLDIYNRPPFLPNPVGLNPRWKIFEVIARTAQEHGLAAIISGDGGDGVFGAHRKNYSACDYGIERGFDRNAANIAMSSARVSDTTLWATFASMVKARVRHKLKLESKMELSTEWEWGLSQDTIQSVELSRDRAPWVEGKSGLPPGKQMQLTATLGRYDYLDYFPSGPLFETIRPILSQPIVECCFRIPYYILQWNGRERGLARHAFADFLSEEVRLRQFKSDGGAPVHAAVDENRQFFTEFLLDGVLSRRGWLDKNAIERARYTGTLTSVQYTRIFDLASVEAWARLWS